MMQLVEQHIMSKNDPHYEVIDQAAFASKNLWNAANYVVRQSFIHEGIYLDTVKVFHHIKSHEAYQALPRKVSNQVLIQLHKAWVAFFEAMAEWREHPEKFLGRPQLPKYKHKTAGRNLLVYEKGAISKRALKRGLLSLSALGELVKTLQKKETIVQARVVPRGTHYVIEVVYERKVEQASVDPSLFAALDLGVSNLAAITSNREGFVPVLVNGRVLKSINQGYNKHREHLQKKLAKETASRPIASTPSPTSAIVGSSISCISPRKPSLDSWWLRVLVPSSSGKTRFGSKRSRWASAITRRLCRSRIRASSRCCATRPNSLVSRSSSPKRVIPAKPASSIAMRCQSTIRATRRSTFSAGGVTDAGIGSKDDTRFILM